MSHNRKLKRVCFDSYMDLALWDIPALARASRVTTETIVIWRSRQKSPHLSSIDKVVDSINNRYAAIGIHVNITRADILEGDLFDGRAMVKQARMKIVSPRRLARTARLTEMRAMLNEGKRQSEIAIFYGISRQRVYQILRGREYYWTQVRKKVLTRDKHQCILCKKDFDLQVHHLHTIMKARKN